MEFPCCDFLAYCDTLWDSDRDYNDQKATRGNVMKQTKIEDLLNAKPRMAHNNSAFAMVHDASAIRDSSWEGMLAEQALQYINELIHLDQEAYPIPFNIAHEQLQVAQHAIKSTLQIYALFSSFLSNNGINIDLEKVLVVIKEHSDLLGGVCYLPAGWCNDEGEAHFDVIRACRLEGSTYVCSVLDRGDGIGFHQPMHQGKNGGKVKRNYSSDEFRIDFQSDFGLFFLESIIRLKIDRRPFDKTEKIVGMRDEYGTSKEIKFSSNKKNIRPYDKLDLYALLMTCGEPQSATDNKSAHSVTPQRTGTCPVTNSLLIISDSLKTVAQCSEVQSKRVTFVLKLASLIEGNKAYHQGNCPAKMFDWAIRESYVRMSKHYQSIINDDEIQLCTDIVGRIREGFNQAQSLLSAKACVVDTLPPLTGAYDRVDKNITQPAEASGKTTITEGEYKENYIEFSPIKLTPHNVIEHINHTHAILEKHYSIYSMIYLYEMMRALPPTTGLPQDPFWDQLPQDQIPLLMEGFHRLVKHLDRYNKLPGCQPIEIALIAYDICAQLVHRLPNMYLNHEYVLGLSDVVSDKIFSEASVYFSVKQILLNFQRRMTGKKPVFSNCVRPNSEDFTCEWMSRHILTKDVKSKALSALKDNGAVKSSIYSLSNEYYINVFLTRKCEITNSHYDSTSIFSERTKTVEFPSENFLGHPFVHLLKISSVVHYRGGDRSYDMKRDARFDATPDLHFIENTAYHRQLTLQNALEQFVRHDFNGSAVGTTLMKHAPRSRAVRGAFGDFAENAIYYPLEELRALKNTHQAYTYPRPVEFTPYHHEFSGSFDKESGSWSSYDINESDREILDEAIKQIESAGSMQIPLLLEWCQYHVDKIVYNGVQSRIRSLLFSINKLDYALCHQHDAVIPLFNLFFDLSIKYYINRLEGEGTKEQLEALLFLIELQSEVLGNVKLCGALYGFEPSQLKIIDTREILQQLLDTKKRYDSSYKARKTKTRVASLLLLFYQHFIEFSQQDLLAILSAKLIASLDRQKGYDGHSLLDLHVIKTWPLFYTHINQLLVSLKKTELDRFINSVVKNALETDIQTEWSYKEGVLSSINPQITLTLKDGALFSNNNQVEDITQTYAYNWRVWRELNLANRKISLLYDGKGYKDNKLDLNIVYAPDYSWEFHSYQLTRCVKVFRGITINTGRKRFQLLATGNDDINPNEKEYFSNKKLTNPFGNETLPSRDFIYSYWINAEDENEIFVESTDYNGTAYHYTPTQGWLRLSVNAEGVWNEDGYILLDVGCPRSDIERRWMDYLNSTVGTNSVSASAQRTNDKEIVIQKMNWGLLGLRFLNVDGQLDCETHPGYFLTPIKSLPCLQGLTCLVVLENDKAERRYLFPAYKLLASPGSHNAALDSSPFLNRNEVLKSECFEYHLDLNNELKGDDVDDDLYLSIIYRCLGDYSRAMQCLSRTKYHKSNQEFQGRIIEMLLARGDLSSKGAAFDCHVAVRMFRHNNKWDERPYYKFTRSESFLRHVIKQFEFYKLSLSERREGVTIIPHYLLLSDADCDIIHELREIQHRKDMKNVGSWGYREKPLGLQIVRFGIELDRFDDEKEGVWFFKDSVSVSRGYNKAAEEWVKAHPVLECRSNPPLKPALRHYYDWVDKELDQFYLDKDRVHHPSINTAECLLEMNFLALFTLALDPNPVVEKRLKLILLTYKLNDAQAQNTHVNIINYILLNRAHFQQFRGKFKANRECMIAVYAHMRKLYDEKKLVTGPLIRSPIKQGLLQTVESLPRIFAATKNFVFSLVDYKMTSTSLHPLQSYVVEYFEEPKREPIAKIEALPFSSENRRKRLEQECIKRLEQGHEQNKTRIKLVYTLKDSANSIGKLQKALVTKRVDIINESELLQDHILQLANKNPYTDGQAEQGFDGHQRALGAYHIALQQAEQVPEMTMSLLFEAYLKQDVNIIARANVFLNQKDLDEIVRKLSDFAVLQSIINLCDDALEIIKDKNSFSELSNYHLQELAKTLDKKRYFKISEYPEFLFYEYMSKKWIREDQYEPLDILIRYIEGELVDDEEVKHALLQFKAGGGKTWLLIPLLTFRFAQKGYLPIIFNTNELHHISLHELPPILRNTLQQLIEIIDRDLNHKWTSEELTQLLVDIKSWHKDKKALMLTPITWHALNSSKRIAYDTNDEPVAKAALAILEYFKQHAIKLEDEGHIQSDPLQQSIKTYGQMQSIPAEQLQVLIDFFDILLGVADNSKHIADIAGIIEKGKKAVTAQELVVLKEELIQRVVEFRCFASVNRSQLKSYYTQEDRKKPEWLKQYRQNNRELASLIVLGRTLIQTLLQHILTLQYQKDFGKSVHFKDLSVGPKHDGKDVTAHFGDQILVAALTIELYAMTGVPVEQPTDYILEIIRLFESAHLKERRWNTKKITKAERSFNAKLPKDYPFISLDNLSAESKKALSDDPTVRFSPDMQKFFLFTYAFRQIRTPEFRVESTAADFQAGFKRSIIFTATPGLPEVYPVYLDKAHYFESAFFEAEVVQKMLDPKNSAHCMLEMTHDPREMFNQIKTKYPDLFLKLCALFERGALFSDLTPTRVANAILASFDEGDERKTVQCFQNNMMVLVSKLKKLNNVTIPGTNVVTAIKRQGLDPKKVLLFLFLDLIKTTGTDIKRPYNDVSGITIGKGQSLPVTIQAIMRFRPFLEQDGEALIWIIFKSLYNQINPGVEHFDLIKISEWFIENFADELNTKVINRAYQGIYEIIAGKIWKLIDQGKVPYGQHKTQLQQRYPIDPYVLYEVECIYDNPQAVLARYRDHLCQRFGLDWAKDFSPTQVHRITRIINETEQLIELMREPHGAELNAQVCQEQTAQIEDEREVEQEQRIKSLVQVGKDFRFRMETYTRANTLQAIFLNDERDFKRIRFEKCSFKMPKLFLNVQNFCPFEDVSEFTATVKYLKPIQAVIVQYNLENNKIRFAALTTAGIQFYAAKIRDHADTKSCYCLVGFDGHILCSSRNMSLQIKERLLSDMKLKRMMAFCALLNGYIKDPKTLQQIVYKYRWDKSDFVQLISVIQKVQVTRSLMSIHSIQDFEEECGWRKVERPINLSEQKLSLFSSGAKSLSVVACQPLAALPERVSAARLLSTPRSVLSCVLFEQKPKLFEAWEVDNTTPAQTKK